MKWFKLLLITSVLVFCISITFFLLIPKKQNLNQPLSVKGDFYKKLENALYIAKLKPMALNIYGFNNKTEFYIDSTKVILSSSKNPYWQIISLQQILKMSKMENRKPELVDLSIDHPYATFKNN